MGKVLTQEQIKHYHEFGYCSPVDDFWKLKPQNFKKTDHSLRSWLS